MDSTTRRTIFLGAVLFVISVNAITDEQFVKCLPKDETTELQLNCSTNAVIRIEEARLGWQDIPVDDRSSCVYVNKVEDDCSQPVPYDLLDYLLESCMGYTTCVVAVKEQFLYGDCGKVSNYVQIKYQCVPDITTANERMIIDVCGDSLGGGRLGIKRAIGYIESLSYPENYPPDTSCSCNLTAVDPGATVKLEVLDMELQASAIVEKATDWLEYTPTMSLWGEGKRLNNAQQGQILDTGARTTFLIFNTDANEEKRGFWLRYTATNEATKTPSDVQASCGVYTPPDYKDAVTCFDKDHHGELFLNCMSQGVINVLHAQTGHQDIITDDQCQVVAKDPCSDAAQDISSIRNECMGQQECKVSVRSYPLEECSTGNDTNYVQAEYHCIKDALDQSNIIDICGDITVGGEINRHVGYIESLNYPHDYSPDTQCTCELRAVGDDSEIVLVVLDAELHGADCGDDWLEYVQGENRWGKGKRLCDQDPSEPIFTGSRTVHVNFFADDNYENRGFWIKYRGNKADTSHAEVQVHCSNYVPPSPSKPTPPTTTARGNDVIKGAANKDDYSPTHQGLIVGLGVCAMLMLVVVFILVSLKCKRAKQESSSLTPSVHDTTPSLSSSGYGSTLRKYSNLMPGRPLPYTTLDEDSQPGSFRAAKPGYQGSSSYPEYPPPDYAGGDQVIFQQGAPPQSTHFDNPAFDSSLGTSMGEGTMGSDVKL